jgi:hypothetical protein
MGVNEEIIAEIYKLEIPEEEKVLMVEMLNSEEEKNTKTISLTKLRDQYKNYFKKFVADQDSD